MNYLAHAYLSLDDREILAGNMISDFVKGKKKFDYPLRIQKGITLHRMIDEFTDFHPATALAKQFFRPVYRLYSGALVDIVYDHFLALDDEQFQQYGGIEKFSQNIYKELASEEPVFPPRFLMLFHYMKQENWFVGYKHIKGIRQAFGGLVHRAAYLHESDSAFQILMEHYDSLASCYHLFFPELKAFVNKHAGNL